MKNDELIPQAQLTQQFRNYVQEIQDRFEQQERVLNGLAGLNTEVVELLKGMQETQQLHGKMLGQIANFLEAQQPPKSSS